MYLHSVTALFQFFRHYTTHYKFIQIILAKLSVWISSQRMIQAWVIKVGIFRCVLFSAQTNIFNSNHDEADFHEKNSLSIQACTEMVMPMCSKDSTKNMFPPNEWNFKNFSDKCYEKFKVRPIKNMATTIYATTDLKYD